MRNLVLVALMLVANMVYAQAQLAPLRGVKRVVFLGDSITYAGEFVDLIDAYVHVHMPREHVEIINLGLPSETVSGLTEPNHAGGAFPRPDLHERLARALEQAKPDLVVACYGINDGIYYPYSDARFQNYQDGIRWLRNQVLASHAKFWMITPPPFDPQPVRSQLLPAGRAEYPSGNTYEGYDDVLTRYSAWLMMLRDEGWKVIDIHTPLDAYLAERRKAEPKFAFAGDGVHLNEIGHRLIAREILSAWGAPSALLPGVEPQVTLPGRESDAHSRFTSLIQERQTLLKDSWLTGVGHKRPGMAKGIAIPDAEKKAAELETQIRGVMATLPPLMPGALSGYHGFDRYDFKVDGRDAIVVAPAALNPKLGTPWIWRAEFFDHRPELDLALLKLGYHLVYIDVGNTFGAPSAMKHWDVFYDLLSKHLGLSSRPTLEGLSRGGLYIYNWAARHPHNVSVLYGDNPVCDFKSWPGGKGVGPGSPDDWKKLQSDYGFRSEEEALAYKLNPVDNLAPLAAAHVPIIHCAADADEAVPYGENTVLLKSRYQALGGDITVIVKHGFHHHPHGLDDPTPLVDFILAHTRR